MKNNKYLNVSFEESLNLSDDSLIKYMIDDTKQRKIYNGKGKSSATLLSIFLIGILYLVAFFTEKGVDKPFKDSPLPEPTINFLPMWIFGLLLLIWFSGVVYLRSKGYLNVKVFINLFNANNFLIWIIIEGNLFILTFFFKTVTVIGVTILFSLIILFLYAILKSKIIAINKQLFNSDSELKNIDVIIQKIIHWIYKYGWVIILSLVGWKFLFPNTAGVRTDIVGFIGIITMWFLMNIAVIVVESYLILPYLLYGYYQYKYPEEYREWEGKTQLEWYGEKYFNKHIKGTEKEEKIND
ncbi:hypothetical protein [Vagococcus salmoninarum]|uniref:hypothetical protein n=1 Tax=Vagococcus salmoninarum TaxID=2739 RepID=UPI00187FB14E|nr:hypothetical protein [Vagococcus salmoninarum]MBE9388584.1 hypothetical protein [Vagococcus salmoninarum]